MKRVFACPLKMLIVMVIVYVCLWVAIVSAADTQGGITVVTDNDLVKTQSNIIIILAGLASSLLAFIFIYAVGTINSKVEKLSDKVDGFIFELNKKVDCIECQRKHHRG